MKIGRASNAERRLNQLLNHGLMDDLVVDAIFIQVPEGRDLAKAESDALRAVSSAAEKRGKEVFSCIEIEDVKEALLRAASNSPDKKLTPTDQDFHEIASSSGMYRSLLCCAYEECLRLGMQGRAEEIKYILENGTDEQINYFMLKLDVA
tara:strand:+ start:536 stop:985 length:450 start_codon:yes stop_codon:yes gene_type:complete